MVSLVGSSVGPHLGPGCVGAAVLYLTRRHVPATRSPHPASVDLPGTTLLGMTLIALLIPLTEGRTMHWPPWMWVLLAMAPVAAVATAVVEQLFQLTTARLLHLPR